MTDDRYHVREHKAASAFAICTFALIAYGFGCGVYLLWLALT